MKTIQMTIDDGLLESVDSAVHDLGTSRSAFIRDALQMALRQHEIEKLEARHAEGYLRQPAKPEEIDEWEDERVWAEP